MLVEMTNLKNCIYQGDMANITHSLHALGQLATKAATRAAIEAGVDEEISSKLRRLGETLNAAGTTLAG